MRAMVLKRIVSLEETRTPLELVDLPVPVPAADEVLIRVRACGVCHTELDEIEGRAAPRSLPIVPGHEVVGHVVECGREVTRWRPGERVGVGWIHHSSGAEDENLSEAFRATGRDVNGGYAEFLTVPQAYAHALPETLADDVAAPLLCAGAIGYRALRLTGLQEGQSLGLTGFGGSAHLVLQLAKHLYPRGRVYVFARHEESRRFALELGADWAGSTEERSPVPLHAIIDTTPAWKPVVEALANLAPGGRLVINAIRKEDRDREALETLRYEDHLWMEKEIKSVANLTRFDLEEFLPLAGSIPLVPTIETYPLEDANRALIDLASRHVKGAKVLLVGG